MQLVDELDPILQNQMDLFEFDDNQTNLAELTTKMFEFMDDNGIGLAAPQIGLPLRLFVMDIDNQKYVCINPEILLHDEIKETKEEGCLSFPGLTIKVKRSKTITVRYYNENGEEQTKVLTDLVSRCFQHETDHLDGITFYQRVSKMVLNMARRRRDKSNREGDKK